jgi:hypothetical protein
MKKLCIACVLLSAMSFASCASTFVANDVSDTGFGARITDRN